MKDCLANFAHAHPFVTFVLAIAAFLAVGFVGGYLFAWRGLGGRFLP